MKKKIKLKCGFCLKFSIFLIFLAQFDQESYQKRELVPLIRNHEN